MTSGDRADRSSATTALPEVPRYGRDGGSQTRGVAGRHRLKVESFQIAKAAKGTAVEGVRIAPDGLLHARKATGALFWSGGPGGLGSRSDSRLGFYGAGYLS